MAFITGGAQQISAENPEALFRDLARLDHGPKHLWAHQADILRDYLNHQHDADLAIELPTGAGKTLVGMLVGEWRRRTLGERVVYLCPTLQLARQAVADAQAAGISVVDLTGTNWGWDANDRLAYTQANAIAVAHYKAVFNSNSQLDDAGLLIFDDAHAASSAIADTWTVRFDHGTTAYDEIVTLLAPGLPGTAAARLLSATHDPTMRSEGFLWIVIDHTIDGQPYSTVYGHMWDDGVAVQVGDTVAAGQHIGEVGNNGQSTGAHLHLEVWQGGRLTGGSETDPQPWLDRAANPGSGGGAPPTDESTTSRQPSPPSSGEMPDSDKIASKENLQVDSIRVARAVAQRFPDVKTIGGWRPVDAYPDHPSGRAVDIMIPDYSSSEGRELGNRITNYLLTHREFFNIEYLIWRQQYIPATGQPYQMEDRGDATQNHFDHVHVTVAGNADILQQMYDLASREG